MMPAIKPIFAGRGWITALGRGIEPVMGRLLAGETGIRPAIRVDASGLRNDLCGEVPGALPQDPAERLAAFLTVAVADALADAGLRVTDLAPEDVIIIGASFGAIFHNAGGPVALDAVLTEALAAMGLCQTTLVLSAACSSSSEALGLASDLIMLGRAERIVTVGIDVVDRYKLAGHSSLSTLSADACRPFDRDASGTIIGEGAAAVVLEAPASVIARSGRSLGRLTGVASTTDTAGATSPDPKGSGAARVLQMALARAGRGPETVAYVNAHGSGTPVNDAMEIKALSRVFDQSRPLVSSTKPAFGHTLGATGIMEAIVALETLRIGQAPPTVGLVNPAPDSEALDLVAHTSRPLVSAANCAMSVTYGFGGANSAVVVDLEQP